MNFRERLTYANVVSTLCLVLIVVGGGGAAYALGKNTVGSKQIINGAIKTKDLKSGAVKGPKVADGSLTGADIANGSIAGADISGMADGTIKAAAMVDGNGVLVNSFNRLGGAISVVRTSEGNYTLTVPGAQGDSSTKIVGVSARNAIAECKPWTGSGETLNVICRDTSDDSVNDATFSLWLIK